MMRAWIIAACAAALGGCLNLSRSQSLAPLPGELATGGRVSEIVLRRAPELKVSGGFDELFRTRVQAKLDACANGQRPLRLEASIDRLDKANPVLTAVVAGANVLRGTARLVDPASGQMVGEYKLGRTIVGRSLAVIAMSEAEEQLSDAFGDELCKQAFASRSR
jgi:hypothetical protein